MKIPQNHDIYDIEQKGLQSDFLSRDFWLSPLELSWTWAAAMLSWSFPQKLGTVGHLKNIRRI